MRLDDRFVRVRARVRTCVSLTIHALRQIHCARARAHTHTHARHAHPPEHAHTPTYLECLLCLIAVRSPLVHQAPCAPEPRTHTHTHNTQKQAHKNQTNPQARTLTHTPGTPPLPPQGPFSTGAPDPPGTRTMYTHAHTRARARAKATPQVPNKPTTRTPVHTHTHTWNASFASSRSVLHRCTRPPVNPNHEPAKKLRPGPSHPESSMDEA